MRPITPILLLALCTLASAAEPITSPWARPGADGRLTYQADERGNTIPDFSRAGYGGGGVALPAVPTVLTLEPQPKGDDGARIQAALDEVGARPADAHGLRGAVLLKRGLYRIGGKVAVRQSGVVLRGEGQGEGDTVILGTGKEQRTLITVGAASASLKETSGTRRRVTDAYVPWSAKSFSIESTDGLKVGDRIVLHRPSTAEWIHELGMDRITNRPKAPEGETKQWPPGGMDLRFERTITAIDGTRLTLDAPVMCALEQRFGGGTVYRYTFSRITESGVENLRVDTEYVKGKEDSDEHHAWTGVELTAVENGWVRDVTAIHLSHAVGTSGSALFTTIQDCTQLAPVSEITGGRRYSFLLNGQYGLVQRCRADNARHTCVTGARVCGPNVFLDCVATNTHADSGPHHRWAVGTLYDNVRDDHELNTQDRQWAGSGHGWAGAQQVFWNCEAKTMIVQRPPTAQNYAIGPIGTFKPGQWSPNAPRGLIDAAGTHVAPRSLYLAQLTERRGPESVAALAR